MGRRRKGKMVLWRILIPEHVALRVEIDAYNNTYNKPEYGVKSQLVTDLLIKHLAEIDARKEPTV